MKKASVRFYEELNDFLHADKRKTRFEHIFSNRPSVKDLIESLGVPHAEVDMIFVNGVSVDFNHIVEDGDDISVYPVFESFDISEVQHLRPAPLRNKKFIADVHLGTLAKYLRMLGIDTLYENNYSDEDIVKIALRDKRTILTKDRGILKRKEITHGYFVRNIYPEEQLKEIKDRYFLGKPEKVFSRCLNCNSLLENCADEKINKLVPEKVKARKSVFYYCSKCDKVYWQGRHYEKMTALINKIFVEG